MKFMGFQIHEIGFHDPFHWLLTRVTVSTKLEGGLELNFHPTFQYSHLPFNNLL